MQPSADEVWPYAAQQGWTLDPPAPNNVMQSQTQAREGTSWVRGHELVAMTNRADDAQLAAKETLTQAKMHSLANVREAPPSLSLAPAL
eukprot:2683683-Heterocapsa_arctica.AAC.1